MSYQLHQTEGIVLRRWPRGEGDALLRMYTKDYGGITLFAKGIRLEKSKLRGAVDVCSHAQIGFVVGKEMYRLTYAVTEGKHARLYQDLARFRACGYVADVFGHAVRDGEPDLGLWQVLEEAFSFFSGDAFSEKHLGIALRSFEVKFVKQMGYLPEAMPRSARVLETSPLGAVLNAITLRDMNELVLFLRPLLYTVHADVEDVVH